MPWNTYIFKDFNMSLLNHRKPLQRQSSLQNNPLTTPPSNRTTSNLPKNIPGNLVKPNRPPLIGILRNKQRSEEIPDHCQCRSTLSTANRATSAVSQIGKHNTKVSLKGRPNSTVKVAWGDDVLDLGEGSLGLELLMTKKEAVLNKISSSKLGRPSMKLVEKLSIASDREQELVLRSREQLAQRLRMSWQDRDISKKNLNIILRPQIKTDDSLKDPIGCSGDQILSSPSAVKEQKSQVTESKRTIKMPSNVEEKLKFEEVILEKDTTNIVDVTNIFHRTIRRRSFLKYDQQSQNNYEPSKSSENSATKRSNTILVIPIIENNLNNKEKNVIEDNNNNTSTKAPCYLSDRPINLQENDEELNVEKVINTEAYQKRELFQKRSNSTFNNPVDISINPISSVTNKPKLIRASSVPSKYAFKPIEKPPHTGARNANVIPKRRRIKSSTIFNKRNSAKHFSNTCDSLTSSTINNSKTVNEQNYACSNRTNQQIRQVYQHSKDIVTMVSLLSPNITDNEEDGDSAVTVLGADGNKDKKLMDKDDLPSERTAKMQHGFTSLRKTVKSVSFQQSSIHSVRSFCVSFPGRRGSVGTTGAIGSGTTHQTINHKKQYNSTTSILQSGINGSKSQEKWGSFSEADDGAGKPKRRLVRTVSESNDGCYASEMSTSGQSGIPRSTSQVQSPISDQGDNINSQSSSLSEVSVVQTVSDKEAYCMNTYRKLTDSGVNISLETIFRGMLTPTEYRLRCKREEAARVFKGQPEDEDQLLEDNSK